MRIVPNRSAGEEKLTSPSAVTEKRLMSMKKTDLIRWLQQHKVELPPKNQLKEYYLGMALQKHAELGGGHRHVQVATEKPAPERKRRGRPRRRSKSPHPSRSSHLSRLRSYLPGRPLSGFLGVGLSRRKVLRFIFVAAIVFGVLGYAYQGD
ncbi:hypothetical protein SELMODRAFT_406014 [Selaginella moellendorffii]|uniref:Uncharacterized protein n=1 Tax=Selaginella moellendorffii TaxID=88036 RepID=D8R0D7_SELML|nr:hypothetical protein SELMODRAFT_406014 [Selaginella moellendorffii]